MWIWGQLLAIILLGEKNNQYIQIMNIARMRLFGNDCDVEEYLT